MKNKRDKKGRFIKGHKINLGRKMPKEFGIAISKRNKGSKLSIETKKKISKTLSNYIGDKALHWKGDKVSYRGLHAYVTKKFGKICFCHICGLQDKNRKYHWARINKNNSRVRSNWLRLCVPCHKNYDLGKLKICTT